MNFSGLAVNRAGLSSILTASRKQGVATDLLDPLLRLFEAEFERGNEAASFTRAFAGLLDPTGVGAS